jgi:copper resistance protein C
MIRFGLILVLLLAATVTGGAHAFLDHAEPGVGSEVKTSPLQVKIWFTERLEPSLSRVQVFDAVGKEVDRRDVHIDSENPAILEVSVPRLKPGKYKVSWRVTSVDTHVTTGTFEFEIGQ